LIDLLQRILNSKKNFCLLNHSISPKQRAKLIDWIIEVMEIFGQSQPTIFRAIYITETYLKQSYCISDLRQLHLIGVVSILIASKLEETSCIKMADLVYHICKNKFSQDEILSKEIEIFQMIQDQINLPTQIEYYNILFELLEIPKKVAPEIKKCSNILLKMFMLSYDIQNIYSAKDLVGYSMIISLKLFDYFNSFFTSQAYILKVVKFAQLDKNNILDKLNHLRQFANNFDDHFPFHNLDTDLISTN
jgi:cyclin B